MGFFVKDGLEQPLIALLCSGERGFGPGVGNWGSIEHSTYQGIFQHCSCT